MSVVSLVKGFCLALCLTLFTSSALAASLADLMEDYWQDQLALNPLSANLNGDMRRSDQLADVSEAGVAKQRAVLDKYLRAIASLNEEDLSAENKVNYQLFRWMLEHERKTLDFNWHYYTFTTYAGWHDGFARNAPRVALKNRKDYDNYLARLQKFPRYAEQNMALMQAGIESGNTQACDALEGYGAGIRGYIKAAKDSDFYKPFKQMPASIDAPSQVILRERAIDIIERDVIAQYRAYADFYEQKYLPACRKVVGLSSVPEGRQLYQHFVRYYTTVDISPEAVHQLGLSEVERIRAEMEKIVKQVEFKGSFKDFLQFLRSDPQFYPKTAQGYLNTAAYISKKADGKLPEYFSYLPRTPYGIEEIPAQIAPKVTPAYYQRGAGDGSRAGKYFINTYDLKSRALYELPALTLHEAVPGHHLQISIQAELKQLPEFRRYYYFHPFGEGWALYAEYLGEEMGMYNTPYERFGRLTYEMWRALRLVVDTGMHAKGWSRQQAIDLMAANSALSLHNIRTEVDRYITWPGQALAYKMGELKIRELRAYAEKALGDQFDLREFHTKVLVNGAVPLSVLERLIKAWVAEQKAG
ncbi:MAG: DUF885 domain-containing protein [Cellvibrionaceae bacterium]|nr:DUF885 domain-containing protein [Cellvibrionaceae bacterium]MCV6627550.1 DUF885 domain-containing protein [Cellvibrionaceae bacterium]